MKSIKKNSIISVFLFFLGRGVHLFFGVGAVCRFIPSCSRYASVALERFGVRKGGILVLKRLFRCHSFGGCGQDPVPFVESDKNKKELL